MSSATIGFSAVLRRNGAAGDAWCVAHGGGTVSLRTCEEDLLAMLEERAAMFEGMESGSSCSASAAGAGLGGGGALLLIEGPNKFAFKAPPPGGGGTTFLLAPAPALALPGAVVSLVPVIPPLAPGSRPMAPRV